MIVSHDEQLLEDACDHIVEVSLGPKRTAGMLWGCHGHTDTRRCLQVRGKKLHHFTGSYKKFIEQRKERDSQLTATAQAQADEIARLQVFVDRFGDKVCFSVKPMVLPAGLHTPGLTLSSL